MSIPFPPRKAVLATFKGLLRYSNPTLPVMNNRRAREHTLISSWAAEVGDLYRKNSNVTDPKEAWRLHNMANDILAYQKANCEHAEAMYIAGWGVNKQATNEQVKAVAGLVGLNLPITYSEEGAPVHTDPDAPATGVSQVNTGFSSSKTGFSGFDLDTGLESPSMAPSTNNQATAQEAQKNNDSTPESR